MSETARVYAQSGRGGIERLCPPHATRILDIGGSSGVFAERIKKQLGAEKVYLADYAQDALDRAAGRVDGTLLVDLNKQGELARALATLEPVDLVFCLCVLEHTYDPWQVVAEIHRALPMGGTLVASLPNTQHLKFLYRTITGKWHYNDTGLFDRTHIRFFSFRSAQRLLTATGLELVAVQPRIPNRRLARFSQLTGGLFARLFALQLEIAVRKTSAEPIDPGFCGSKVRGA